MRIVLRVRGRIALPVYNIDGFPGGHTDKEAAARTNDIVEAIVSHDAVGAYRAMRAHLLSARSAASRISPAWSNAATPPPSPSPDRDPA